MSLADFQRIPELSGNFFVGRIFQLSDTDKDGFITVDDFTAAVEMLGKVYSEEEKIRCECCFPNATSHNTACPV